MKKNNETILLILFCVGIIVGLLFPKWMFGSIRMDFKVLEAEVFQQYITSEINYKAILEKVVFSRLTVFFILYFSCYSAAGFWMISGTVFTVGLSMGFFAAMSVLQLKYWGILFWCCALLPQWGFYAWAGKRMISFMEKRKRRTEFCAGNAVPAFDWKVFVEFLKMLGLTFLGIFSEVYVNIEILVVFLQFYLNRR